MEPPGQEAGLWSGTQRVGTVVGINPHNQVTYQEHFKMGFSKDDWSVCPPAAVEDDDGEWDDDWDDQSVGSYQGNGQVDEEGGASGQTTHGPSVKISLNK